MSSAIVLADEVAQLLHDELARARGCDVSPADAEAVAPRVVALVLLKARVALCTRTKRTPLTSATSALQWADHVLADLDGDS